MREIKKKEYKYKEGQQDIVGLGVLPATYEKPANVAINIIKENLYIGTMEQY
ncbi:hypothetical protein SCB17_003096 [Clostridium perfringens]|nr:hypothetical protein [Clostridium perfringens]